MATTPRISDVIDAALLLGDNAVDELLSGRALSEATVPEMRRLVAMAVAN